MFDDRIGNLQKMLARMGPEGRQKYATDHADDPIAVSMALFVNNIAKEIKEGKRGEPDMPPPVVQQAIQSMTQPKMPQGGPPQGMPPQGMPPQGPPQGPPPQGMPPQGMPPQGQPQTPQGMPPPQGQPQMAADGGYMDSRLPEDMGIGALPERSLSNMADGGIVGYAFGGTPKGKKLPSFNDALDAEGIQDPRQRAFLKALYGQETESGANTTTSNQGAVGHMQIKPSTFEQVADKNMDINNPFDNMRAGIRYGIEGYNAAGGNPVLAGAYYYGGPDGMKDLAKGKVRTDSKNSKAPNTLEYGKSIAQRMTALLPIGTAQAGEAAPASPASAPVAAAPAAAPKKSIEDRIRETLLSPVDTKPFSEVPRAMVQGLGSQIAGLGMGVAGAVMPGKEGQGAEAAKRAEQAVGGYQPTSESSKRILDALGYLPNKFSEYVSKPVGEAIDKATGSTTAGDIATRISDLVPLFIPGSRKGTTPPKVANVEPVQATAPTPAVRTVPLPKQVAAGNPPAVKPPVAQPPIALPPPEGIERINRATENNAAAKLAAEQEAAAKAGAPPPPNLTPNQKIVPAPKVNVEGGLPSIITPEAAAFKAQAVARAEARAAERAAEKTAEKPVVTAADAVKAAEAAKAAEAQVAAGSRAALQERPAPSNFPKPSVVGAGAVGAGAAATEGANNDNEEANPNSGMSFREQMEQYGRGRMFAENPQPYEFTNDRKSGDDTTQFPSITPEIAETAVTLAKAEIPKKEQSGFGYEDLMMFGLQLMAGQSPNALTNVGTAGIAALTAKQARAKAETEKSKSEAESDYYKARSEAYRDTILTGPEKRALAKEKVDSAREAKEDRARLQQIDLERKIEADKVARQAKAEAVLDKDREYQLALINALGAKSAFDRISNPTDQEKEKYLQSQDIPKKIKREIYKSFGINPTGSNTSSAGWNIAPRSLIKIMPNFRVTSPEGKAYIVTAPEGATEEEILSYAQNNFNTEKKVATPTTAAIPERTYGEVAKDVGAAVATGLGGLGQFPGQLYGLATGDFSETGLYGKAKELEKYGESLKSPGLVAREKASQARIAESEKEGQVSAFFTAIKEIITDPVQLPNFLISQSLQSIPSIAAALVPLVGPAASAEIKALQIATKTATSVAAREIAEKELKDYVANVAIKTGTRQAIGTGAVQQGADIGTGAYEDIYKKLISQDVPEDQAAERALGLARSAGASGAAISLLAQNLPGARVLEERLAGMRFGSPGGVGGNIASRLASGVGVGLKEGLTEIPEEVGGKFSQNLAMQQVDPTQSLAEGLGATGGQAFIGGFGLGTVIGSLTNGDSAKIAEEKRSIEQAKLQTQKEQALEQQNLTKTQLGITKEQQQLALPAPDELFKQTSNPLFNPFGNYSAADLGINPEVDAYVKQHRQLTGKPNIGSYSIEDIQDAMPGTNTAAEKAAIDSFITAKTGYTPEVTYTAQDIQNVATQKNIETKTKGFDDFLTRTTGINNVAEMSQPQLHAAFTALAQLPKSPDLQILPQGTNATRFTEDQYKKSIESLKAVGNNFSREDALNKIYDQIKVPYVEPVDPIAVNKAPDAEAEQRNKTYFEDLQRKNAESILSKALRENDLETVKVPKFDVIAPDGSVTVSPLTRESANRIAEKTEGFTVKESSVEKIAVVDQSVLPKGFDIQQQSFKQDGVPGGYQIKAGNVLISPTAFATEEEATNKVKSYEAVRAKQIESIDKQLTKLEAEKTKGQNELDAMEVSGSSSTPAYRVASAAYDNQVRGIDTKVVGLNKQKELLAVPLQIIPTGSAIRSGFTVFEQGIPKATLPTKQAAEEHIIANASDETLQNISTSPTPNRLRNKATEEINRRAGNVEPGIRVARSPELAVQADVENQAQMAKLEETLKPLLAKFGLNTTKLKVAKEIDGGKAEASYAGIQDLINIAFDAVNPVRALRHESVHALKELGFFTDGQWKALVNQANTKWVNKYLKQKNISGNPLAAGEKSRYEAYMEAYDGNQEAIIEEAIADAFADFDVNGAPAGFMAALLTKIQNFFKALLNSLNGAGFQTAEDIFGKVERGELRGTKESNAVKKASLKNTKKGFFNPNINPKYEKVITDVINEMGLTPEEFSSTSLIYQTGKAGIEQFESNKIGGLPEVVQFLQDQRRKSNLPLLDVEKPEDRKVLAKLMATEAMAAIRSGGANLEWYDSIINKTLAMAGLKYVELNTDINARMVFRIATAITSQGLNVEENLGFAMNVYDQFRINKKFPEIGQGKDEPSMISNFKLANYLMADMGPNLMRQFLETEFTVEELRNAGFNIAGELGDEKVLGSSVFGPKIGFGFYSNLNGNFNPVTMDMWFMRTIGRLTGKLKSFRQDLYDVQLDKFREALDINGGNGVFANQFDQNEIDLAKVDDKAAEVLARKVKSAHEKDFKVNRAGFNDGTREKSKLVAVSETMIKSLDTPRDAPANGSERRNLRDVVRQMVNIVEEKYGERVPPASLQAVIWYPEQELYKAMGVKLKVTSQSYAGAMEKILKGEGYGESDLSAAAKLGSRTAQQLAKSTIAKRSQATSTEPVKLGPLQAGEKEALLYRGRRRVVLEEEKETPKRKRVTFEVAPDPNNKALTAKWKALSNEEQIEISDKIGNKIIKDALDKFGLKGYIETQIGSYLNDTNPSFILYLDSGDSIAIAKFLGYALSQDMMIVVSPKESKGLEKTGAVRIKLNNMSATQVENVYKQLRQIEFNGFNPVSGQSYANGHMVILNLPDEETKKLLISTKELASLINDKLNNDFEVITEDVYTAFPTKKDYDYANPSSDPRGNSSVLRQNSRNLRSEATRLLQKELAGRELAERQKNIATSPAAKATENLRNVITDKTLLEIQKELNQYDKNMVLVNDQITKTQRNRANEALAPYMILAEQEKPAFDAMVERIGNDVGIQVRTDAIKNIVRAAEKLVLETENGKKNPNGSLILDLLRTTIVVNNESKITKAIEKIEKSFEVVRKKDRFKDPVETGYRDFLVNVKLPSGLVAEIQINIPAMIGSKSAGHKLYRMSRNMEKGSSKRAYLESLSRRLYNEAYRFSQNDISSALARDALLRKTSEGKDLSGSAAKTIEPSSSLRTGVASTAQTVAPFGTSNIASPTKNDSITKTKDEFDAKKEKYSLRKAPDTPEFKRWFGDSKAVDENGKPILMYHGTNRDFNEPRTQSRGAFFVTPSINFANKYAANDLSWFPGKKNKAGMEYVELGANVMPVWVSVQNPFDYNNKEHVDKIIPAFRKALKEEEGYSNKEIASTIYNLRQGNYRAVSAANDYDIISKAGFDGFWEYEANVRNLGVFKPEQIKSATGNIGTYDAANPDIRYSLRTVGEPATEENVLAAMKMGQEKQPYMNCQLCVQMATGVTKLLNLPKVKKAQVGDVYTFNERKNMASHYAIDIGNGNIAEVEGWGEEVRTVPLQEVVDEYGEPDSILRPPSTAYTGNTGTYDPTNPDIRYSLRQIDDFFNKAEEIKEPEGVEIIRENWIGSVSGLGDRDSAYDLYRVQGGKQYMQNVQDLVRESFGDEFKGYRLMHVDELEEIKAGAMGSQLASFTLRPDVAQSFANLATFRKIPKNQLTVVEMDLTPKHVVMIGHTGERELVVDYEQGYNPDAVVEYQPKKLSLRKAPDTPEFKRFFSGSKVVNEDGSPKVMYHGTNKDFNEFVIAEKANRAGMPDGFYFTSDEDDASRYAKGDGASVMPVYLSIKNPFNLGKKNKISNEMVMQFRDELRADNPTLPFDWIQEKVNIFKERTAAGTFPFPSISFPTAAMQRVFKVGGYDGLIDGSRVFVAFDSKQVKSATGNIGTYDPTNPDIRYSLTQKVNSLPNSSKILDSVNKIISVQDQTGHVERMIAAFSPKSRSNFRAAIIDRYNQIGVNSKQVAKLKGENWLLADVSAEAAANMSDLATGVSASALGVGQGKGGIPVYANGFTKVFNDDGKIKGAVEIFSTLAKYNNPEIYRLYQWWAGSLRGKRLLDDGREQKYDQNDIKLAEELLVSFPEFKQVQKEWIVYNDGLVKYAVDTGVLTKEAGEKFKEYGDYIPFYRQIDGEQTVGPNIFSGISGVKGPKALKGSEAPLADFLETIVRNTQSIIESGMKNVAAERAVRDAIILGQAEKLNFQPTSFKSDVVSYQEKGKTVYYRLADPALFEAMKGLNLPDLPWLGILSAPANLLRTLVTKDPGFMLVNLMRDSVSAWVTSGSNMTPIVDTMNQFVKTLAGKSPEAEALMMSGVLGGYDFASNVKSGGKDLAKYLRKTTKTKTTTEFLATPFTSVWEALEKGSTASDAATRAAIYRKVMDETGNEAEAIYRALEVMNFNRKGNAAVIRILTAVVPFLNARIQGLDVLYRASFGEMASKDAKAIQKAFIIRSLFLMGMTALYYAATSDDDEYKKQEQEVRDNNWLIPSLGIKIPIPFEIGVLFKVIPERIMAYHYGTDTGKELFESAARNIVSTFAFNPVPQAIIPFVETATNYSFFTGREIVPRELKDVSPEFQTNAGTSGLAKRISSGLADILPSGLKEKSLSPIQIDHIVNGYTGTLGMYASSMLNSVFDRTTDPTRADLRLEQMPVLRRILIDKEAKGNVTAYYDLKHSTDTMVRTINLLEKTQNFEEMGKYQQENLNLLATQDYMKDLAKMMKELNEYSVMIKSSQMDGTSKRDALLAINQAQNNVTSNIKTIRKMLN